MEECHLLKDVLLPTSEREGDVFESAYRKKCPLIEESVNRDSILCGPYY